MAGIGTGTLVMVPLVEWVIDNQGWRDAYRLLAIMTAVLLTVAVIGAHRPPTSAASPEPIREAIRGRVDFWILYVSSILISITLFTPFVFLADYIDTVGGTGSAAVLLGLIGMSSIAGRLGFGAVAACIGITGLYQLSFLVLSLSVLVWIVADTSYSLLILFAVVLGVAYGGFIALSPAFVAARFGVVGMGGVLGALYTAAGVGGLVGPPTIGAIIDASGHTAAQITALVSGLLGTALLLTMRPPPATA